MRTRALLTAMAVMLAMPAAVAAQDDVQTQSPLPGGGLGTMGSPQALFERLDADGDGRVTMDEATAFRAGVFRQMDADGDGEMTRDEAIAFARAAIEVRVDQRMGFLDTDGSGTVSAEEFAAGRSGFVFRRLDANGDGIITPDELPHRGRGPGRR